MLLRKKVYVADKGNKGVRLMVRYYITIDYIKLFYFNNFLPFISFSNILI